MFLVDKDITTAISRRDRHLDAVQWPEAQGTKDLHLIADTISEIE